MTHRTLRRLISAAAAAVVLTGCLNLPVPGPVPPDATDAAPPRPPMPMADASPDRCAAACAALRLAGCGLGDAGDCAGYLGALEASGHVPNAATHMPFLCADVVAVKVKADARAIGFGCP
jgi:hypothetical protein